MSSTLRILLNILGYLATIYGGLDLLGATWSDIGNHMLLLLPFNKPVPFALLVIGIGLISLHIRTRGRALYLRENSQILVFDGLDGSKAHLEINQVIQAYADNVTAMFSTCSPDPDVELSAVPRDGISFSLKSGQTAFQKQSILREGTDQPAFFVPGSM